VPDRGAGAAPEPSRGTRVGGVAVAIITGALAVLLIATLFTADVSAVDVVMRVISALVLGTIAVGVGVMALAPGLVRAFFERRSGR
jgi:hypothetical protein